MSAKVESLQKLFTPKVVFSKASLDIEQDRSIKGAKIEAIVAGNDLVHRFDLTLHMGRKYIIHGVTIRPNFEEVECRFINHTYECSFSARTFVESLSLEFPRYPKHLMSVHEVMRCPNKTFVDIVGIVVQYDDHQLIGRHPSAELYREVTFMDIWGKLIVVGISGGNLIQNSYRWSTTEGNKSIVLATMLRAQKLEAKYGKYPPRFNIPANF
ncbi:hypothetical protein D1007_27813 [Hordeum vulgare]|nr:hypothetical protein D1007_27813 [Hordeum vulgare]